MKWPVLQITALICSVHTVYGLRRLPPEDLRPDLRDHLPDSWPTDSWPTVAAAVADVKWQWRMLAESETADGDDSNSTEELEFADSSWIWEELVLPNENGEWPARTCVNRAVPGCEDLTALIGCEGALTTAGSTGPTVAVADICGTQCRGCTCACPRYTWSDVSVSCRVVFRG